MSDELMSRADGAVRVALERVAKQAVKTLEGLYKEAGEQGYNPDADKNWADCSMRTRAALVIVKGYQEHAGADTRVLGIVFLQGRSSSPKEWEAEAKRVDAEERVRTAIDVEAVGNG